MTDRIPTEIKNHITAYIEDNNTLGFNHTTKTDDGMAEYQLKHWTSTSETVTVGLWIASFGILEPHANQLTEYLQSHGFTCKEAFHQIEDEYADHMNMTAFEATFTVP